MNRYYTMMFAATLAEPALQAQAAEPTQHGGRSKATPESQTNMLKMAGEDAGRRLQLQGVRPT